MDREQAIETLQACIRGCVRRESREPSTTFARDSDLLTGVLTWLQAQVPYRTQNNHPVKVPAVPSKKATMSHIHLKVYSCLCAAEEFTVNGIAADVDDFGEHCDRSPDTAEEYGCGDMQFTGIPPTPEVLLKYGIDQATYDEVVERLDALSFGQCGWCV